MGVTNGRRTSRSSVPARQGKVQLVVQLSYAALVRDWLRVLVARRDRQLRQCRERG
jgi:hypothetical protein